MCSMGHLVWKSSFKRASSFQTSSYQSILDLIKQEEEEEADVLGKQRPSGENQEVSDFPTCCPRLDLRSLLGKP